MITAAIIGISGFGRIHYTDLLRQVEKGTMRLVGATVINQAQEVEKCNQLKSIGCEIFADYHSMFEKLKGKIDLCCIPTGIHMHAPMTLAALRAGANVFVEKPAAATFQDVLLMKDCAKKANRFVAVGYQTMYARETLVMKKAILNQEIGRVLSIKSRGLWPRLDDYYTRNQWAGRLRLGDTWILDSPFNNAMAHQLNMICFLAGTELHKPAKLKEIQAELYKAHDIESADTAAIRATTDEGVPLYFLVTHSSEENLNPEIIVRGEKGQIYWTFEKLVISRADGTKLEMPCESDKELRNTIMARLLKRIEDKNTFICDLDIAGTQTLCVNAAHDSSPVHPVSEDYVSRLQYEESIKTVIKEIDQIIHEAFEQEKLFSELGIPWAHSGKKISVNTYSYFPSM